MPQSQEESFELGLPFTMQDIPELEGVPDVSGRLNPWIDYTQDGYCSRNIVGLSSSDYWRLDHFASRIQGERIDTGIIEPSDLYRIMMSQETVMDEYYDELKVLVVALQRISWFPFQQVLWAYTCQKFNALIDTLLNALSVEQRITNALSGLENQMAARNKRRAGSDFGQLLLQRAITDAIEVNLLPIPHPRDRWIWLYTECATRQGSESYRRLSQLLHNPNSLNMASDVESRWLAQTAWMTSLNDRQCRRIWRDSMATSMSNAIEGLLPPHSVTLDELRTRNKEGVTRAVRMDHRTFSTRKFSHRTRSCNARVKYNNHAPDGYFDLRSEEQPNQGRQHRRHFETRPDLIARHDPSELWNNERVYDLINWESARIFVAAKSTSSSNRVNAPLRWTRRPGSFTERTLDIKSSIIVGWFPGNKGDPKEMCIRFNDCDEDKFFHDLYLHIIVLRGWRYIFSFKTVQRFGLYKCEVRKGAHGTYQMSPAVAATLAQLFHAYNRGESSPAINIAWLRWCQENLSGGGGGVWHTPAPCQSQLSLKLILKWSQWRLTVASLVPLLLSFIIGMWYQFTYDDPQTGYTISAYIVTAGAFLIALLAVLTALKDGTAE